jgi:hypothetical protein
MGFPNDPSFYNQKETTMTTNLRPVADIDPVDEDYDLPFEPGDICTTDDGLIIRTDHGNWAITHEMGLRLICGLSSLMIRTDEQEN